MLNLHLKVTYFWIKTKQLQYSYSSDITSTLAFNNLNKSPESVTKISKSSPSQLVEESGFWMPLCMHGINHMAKCSDALTMCSLQVSSFFVCHFQRTFASL